MDSSMFDSAAEHNFYGVEDKFSSSNRSYGSFDGEGMQIPFSEAEDWGESGEFNSFSEFGFYSNSPMENQLLFAEYQNQQEQPQSLSEYGLLDDLRFDIASPPIQACLEEIANSGRFLAEQQDHLVPKKAEFTLSSLELLKHYGSGFKRLNGEGMLDAKDKREKVGSSTVETIRIASARFIQSSSVIADDHPMSSHPSSNYFSRLSEAEMKDVQLLEILLAAAEKVGSQEYDSAIELLDHCDQACCCTGNAVERVVFYFSEALRQKIDEETGVITEKGLGKRKIRNLDEEIMRPTPTIIASHQQIPFYQIQQFTAIETILDSITEAKKVHVIDFAMRNGVHWTVLMQGLVARQECPLELLKITAVGTCSRQVIEDTGKRLESFAQLLNIPFSFQVIMLQNMVDLNDDLFDLDDHESVVVYTHFVLKSMIPWPEQLESVVKAIKQMNPCIMVVTEVESNLNSPNLVDRFAETLFYYGAYFDCLEECMERDDDNRTIYESNFFGQCIRAVLSEEGDQRTIRHVKIDVWRAFFSRFGMFEVDLGMASLYQADLVVKKFRCGRSCTLDMNGKSLIIGWKGTPIHSLSAWKFRLEE